MAVIDPRQQEEEQQQQTAVAGGNTDSQSSGAGDASTATNQQPQQKAQVTDFDKIKSQNTQMDFGYLLDPVNQQVGKTRQGLDTSWNDFVNQAGSEDPWDNTETSVLDNAIKNGQGIDQAQGVLNRKYTGPTDFTGDWSNDLTSLRNTTSSLNNADGISSALRQINPNYTQGASRFDGLLASRDSNFQDAVKNATTQVANLQSDADKKTADAKSMVTKRQQDAADVQSKSQSYLSDWRNNISSAINSSYNTAINQYSQTPSAPKLSSIGVRDDLYNDFVNTGVPVNNSSAWTYNAGIAPMADRVTTANQATEFNNIGKILGDNQSIASNAEGWQAPSYSYSDSFKNWMDGFMNQPVADSATRGQYVDRARNLGYSGSLGSTDALNSWLSSGGAGNAPTGFARQDVIDAVNRGDTNYLDWWNAWGSKGY